MNEKNLDQNRQYFEVFVCTLINSYLYVLLSTVSMEKVLEVYYFYGWYQDMQLPNIYLN